MTGDTKLLIYIRKGWCFAGWRELFLVRVGERPKAVSQDGELFLVRVGERPNTPLHELHELHARTFWVRGGVRPKTPLLGRSEALLGNTRLSPSNR